MQNWSTIPEMVFAQAKKYGDKNVLRAKQEGRYQGISWSELIVQIQGVALGLMDLGFSPGDRAAILSENRPEWVYADLGILSAGGITVPIYTSLSAEEIKYILHNAGARILFVSSPELMAKVLPFQNALSLKIILFDAPYRISGPRVFWLGELIGLGKAGSRDLEPLFEERLKKIRLDDVASLIYTSGTTGPPKGVMLTHSNFLSNCQAVSRALPITQSDSTLSFLPLSHVFERMAGYYFVLSVGGEIAYAETMEKVGQNLGEVCPTIVTGVPRFYEKLHERIHASIQAAPSMRRRLALWALRVGDERAKRILKGETVSCSLRLRSLVADRLLFSKLRSRMGGRLRFCVSGGAPLSKDLAEFFYRAGILILEGYGLTETSPVIAVNRPGRFRFGSVGVPVSGAEVRIGEDGEILTRGPHVMRGYFENPAATADVIDQEGWFHTGDIGTLDSQGFLTITDRKKDLIKTSGGKMVAPQNLENALKKDPYIADCIVIGDLRKYLTALIVPQVAAVEAYAKNHRITAGSIEGLLADPKIHALLWERVEGVNAHLASFEQIKKITLLPQPFTQGSGELTPTLKVKRRVVAERCADQIEAMYRE